MKVLLVEDSVRLQRSLEAGLRNSGFAVDVVGDGTSALTLARRREHDVIVLDLLLPGLNGLAVLQRLREEGDPVHVLILSARDRISERIAGLRAGADDYLTKPFAFDELVARLRALLRRRYTAKSPRIELGPLEVDTAGRTVRRGDHEIPLRRGEYALLEYLLARRGAVVSKQELMQHLYDDAQQASENAVEVRVHQLRRKLREAGASNAIETRRGQGYMIA